MFPRVLAEPGPQPINIVGLALLPFGVALHTWYMMQRAQLASGEPLAPAGADAEAGAPGGGKAAPPTETTSLVEEKSGSGSGGGCAIS